MTSFLVLLKKKPIFVKLIHSFLIKTCADSGIVQLHNRAKSERKTWCSLFSNDTYFLYTQLQCIHSKTYTF